MRKGHGHARCIFRSAGGGAAFSGDLHPVRCTGVCGGRGLRRVPVLDRGSGAHLLRPGENCGDGPGRGSGGPVRPGLRDTILMYQKCREIMGQVLEPGAI